jgi:5-(carboxyamino)imidazole ribonucleotide synthase
MSTNTTSPAHIGIIGGGQLGRMLVQAAARFGCSCTILDPDPDCPAGQIAANQLVGSCHDDTQLRRLAAACDLITYEREDINSETLGQLAAAGHTIYPEPHILAIIQDKLSQKQYLQQHNIPTAPFIALDRPNQQACDDFGYPLVQKARRGGYDGRGVQIMRSAADFVRHLPVPSLLEACVPIQKELAVMVTRGQDGHSIAYPPVEMHFHPEHNLLDLLLAPADIPTDIATAARDLALQVVNTLQGIGIFGIELFLDTQGQLLVNEIAPRTHNSGHHTLDANITDQFEQQLRAILGLPLGSTDALSPAAMINLLGASNSRGTPTVCGLDTILQQPGVCYHWYAKKETRPQRKMGHITILNADLNQARNMATHIREQLQIHGSTHEHP